MKQNLNNLKLKINKGFVKYYVLNDQPFILYFQNQTLMQLSTSEITEKRRNDLLSSHFSTVHQTLTRNFSDVTSFRSRVFKVYNPNHITLDK